MDGERVFFAHKLIIYLDEIKADQVTVRKKCILSNIFYLLYRPHEEGLSNAY